MYVLMKGDEPVRSFDLRNHREATNGMTDWLVNRQSNRERAGMEAIFSKYSLNHFSEFIRFTHCLSLNDCYWVKAFEDKTTFSEINLYDNPFDDVISQVAFTGEGGFKPTLSPEYTTHGALAKRWFRRNGEIYLAKGGDYEPYAEYVASELADFLNLHNFVKYDLSHIGSVPVSTCKLFTSKQVGFSPARLYLDRYLYENVVELFGKYEEFWDMMLLDYLIVNTDRHYDNFGFLVDNYTEDIVGMAPIFDNGCGCLSQWSGKGERIDYIESRVPVFGGSFYSNMRTDVARLRRAAEFECSYNEFTSRASHVIRYRALDALGLATNKFGGGR